MMRSGLAHHVLPWLCAPPPSSFVRLPGRRPWRCRCYRPSRRRCCCTRATPIVCSIRSGRLHALLPPMGAWRQQQHQQLQQLRRLQLSPGGWRCNVADGHSRLQEQISGLCDSSFLGSRTFSSLSTSDLSTTSVQNLRKWSRIGVKNTTCLTQCLWVAGAPCSGCLFGQQLSCRLAARETLVSGGPGNLHLSLLLSL
jgi:hypothetical protein